MNRVVRSNTLRSVCASVVLAASATVIMAPTAQASASPDSWWVYVHNDKVADVNALLAKGADPNVRYSNGQPALMRAVVDNAWKVFDALAADPRTDLNATNPANETALMYLAVAGQTERAKALISRGAQVNRLGWTPLHYAASKGNLDTAKLLLSHKAMVNAPSPEGTTPIMMAAFSGEMPMVQLLLNAGADITTRNLKGQNAVDWAIAGKQTWLADDLKPMVAAAQAKRAGGRTESVRQPSAAPDVDLAKPPVITSPEASRASTDIRNEGVQGVSGVRLNNYE